MWITSDKRDYRSVSEVGAGNTARLGSYFAVHLHLASKLAMSAYRLHAADRLAQPDLLTLSIKRSCGKAASRFYFGLHRQYIQSGATKSKQFRVPRRKYVLSCSRDTSDCICCLPNSYWDRAR
jgi:hypothetical protein